MADIATVITEYQERCTRLLQNATPDSVEQQAYARIIKAFHQNETGEPPDRSFRIAQDLAFEANSIEALPLAPQETLEKLAHVQRIVTRWAEDFKQDTRHTLVRFTFVEH